MNRLPLASFRLRNFKAVRDSGTVKFGPLTVLIGNNGSGKSSLVEGLETFCAVVLDGLDAAMRRWRGFEHIWNQAVEHELNPSSEQRPRHSNPMAFQMVLNVDHFRVQAQQVINSAKPGNELYIEHEEIVRKGREPFDRVIRDAHGQQQVVPFDKGKPINVSPRMRDGQSILTDMLGNFLEHWQFLALVPDAIGQSFPQQSTAGRIRLAKNGANIAEYLNEIRTLDQDAFNGILDLLRHVLPYLGSLEPTLTSELERAFHLRFQEEEFELPGWLLSTGTLRIAALLACLRHPQPPPLVVIEEIENGLDPRTLHLLVEELRAAITVGTTQIIATTHSPYLLDLLDLSHIVVVQRVDGQPTFTRPNEEALAEWAKTFSPGRLYTMGRLTRDD